MKSDVLILSPILNASTHWKTHGVLYEKNVVIVQKSEKVLV